MKRIALVLLVVATLCSARALCGLLFELTGAEVVGFQLFSPHSLPLGAEDVHVGHFHLAQVPRTTEPAAVPTTGECWLVNGHDLTFLADLGAPGDMLIPLLLVLAMILLVRRTIPVPPLSLVLPGIPPPAPPPRFG